MPYFSIVIPMYNREHFIGRAIASCLGQTFDDFEVIVVDDGSTDRSTAVVDRYSDPRITLVRSIQNRGVCPARNLGVASASAEWIVFLDSDDELLPQALETMHRCAAHVSEDIGRMLFMYRFEDGSLSPQPPLTEAIWDYPAYLQWLDSIHGCTDFHNCIRRRTFDRVRLPEDRAFERMYHLEFARHFKSQTFSAVVAVIHTDANNRTTSTSLEGLLTEAHDEAQIADRLLAEHGESMAKYCPVAFQRTLQSTAIRHFLARSRLRGWKRAFDSLRMRPLSPRGWVVVLLGILDARTVGHVFLWKLHRVAAGPK